jgi:hypothetical protein
VSGVYEYHLRALATSAYFTRVDEVLTVLCGSGLGARFGRVALFFGGNYRGRLEHDGSACAWFPKCLSLCSLGALPCTFLVCRTIKRPYFLTLEIIVLLVYLELVDAVCDERALHASFVVDPHSHIFSKTT